MLKTLAFVLALGVAAAAATGLSSAPAPAATARPAPEFAPGAWINSAPLTLEQLRGKVVLVEFWTYTCINCIHVTPYVKQWHERYKGDGLVVVGVHTPEYDEEKIPGNVRDAVRRYGITYPVVQDNDYATWNAYGNQYWPALYLVDQDGRIVYRHYGEGGYDATEAKIRALLAQR